MYVSEELCQEQMLLMVEGLGSWVEFPDTIHELLAHLVEVIGKTNRWYTQLYQIQTKQQYYYS